MRKLRDLTRQGMMVLEIESGTKLATIIIKEFIGVAYENIIIKKIYPWNGWGRFNRNDG